MAERVVWIDRAVADFHEESIYIVKWSGDVEMQERWSRVAFRDFVERSKDMLDAMDRKPSSVKRFSRKKPDPRHG